ncbi:hypothetical protein I314_04196 [Cryptococcus bacillisporus CA1873]|uniref:Uncharacterized protein n=2 Tax=Cryptococcus gattii TaxID=552467 RepID=A0A0D0VJM4_CRYGA|nr:hypothetical protein I312_04188 [Cryptococcus bacillisporus CA1280]KIR59763.1 hypothetical protein I314_04196 [Cryptococcus bacillisporus CA1873]|eukprot:KIR59763.1 hypothetical protein I314_04196 [Cryptococcus gattii CA1873]
MYIQSIMVLCRHPEDCTGYIFGYRLLSNNLPFAIKPMAITIQETPRRSLIVMCT